MKGAGDGPAAAQLTPRPRDFADPTWANTVTDETIRRAIVGGGAAVNKSPLMPPNPDLQRQPQVVNELVAIVRSLSRRTPGATDGATAPDR